MRTGRRHKKPLTHLMTSNGVISPLKTGRRNPKSATPDGKTRAFVASFENGQNTHTVWYGPDGKTKSSEIEYKNGQKKIETHYYTNELKQYEITYGADGEKQRIDYYSFGGIHKQEITLNKNGTKKHEVVFSLVDGHKFSETNYDDNGKKEHELWYQKDEKTKSSEVFYEGENQVRQITYDKNGNIENDSLKEISKDQIKANDAQAVQNSTVLDALKGNAEKVTEQNDSIQRTTIHESNNR